MMSMNALIKKELNSLFCSVVGWFFALFLLLITGLMLWLFAGEYNILDNGYASMEQFFALSPLLLMILIPVLTMRSFAEEKRTKTYELLRSRPISIFTIFFSKLVASWLFIVICILPSLIYIGSLYGLSLPNGSIDLSAILASYLSLFLLAFTFCCVGIFCSSLSKNQMLALLAAILINLFVYYGADLCASLFMSGKTQSILSSLGLNEHYKLMQRGVIQLSDITAMLNYCALFSLASIYILSLDKHKKSFLYFAGGIVFINLCLLLMPLVRFDFTADKRYSMSAYSKQMLQNLGKEKRHLKLTVFLEGDLNPAFQRLQNASKYLTSDLNRYANNALTVSFVSPYASGGSVQSVRKRMEQQGMPGLVLNEVSRDGKSTQKVIYPYAQLISDRDTIQIPLLKNLVGNTAEDNLNASIENLEFQFMDAIRLITRKEERSIAFIEGHNELPREYVQDAEVLLSKYFSVNRGQIGYNLSELLAFRVIIIAGPISQFSEHEKYILDQYCMNGGRLLWLIDGVYYSPDKLAQTGQSPSMKNEINLDDLLFSYGIRINPILIQDALSSSILLNMGQKDEQSTVIPCYYSPLLSATPNNPITKDISNVKAMFVSSIDFVGHNKDVQRTILLASSSNTHVVKIPEMINFNVSSIQADPSYFKQPSLPVAASLEGQFNSAFVNLPSPDSVMGDQKRRNKSVHTKMIVAASSSIIRNELRGKDENTQVLPMGYDRLQNKQYGNRDFIVNAVNWLANDDNWMDLRSKQEQLRLLDKKKIDDHRTRYVVLNCTLPILLILLFLGVITLRRRYRYKK